MIVDGPSARENIRSLWTTHGSRGTRRYGRSFAVVMSLLYGELYLMLLVLSIGGFYVATKLEPVSLLLAAPIALGSVAVAGRLYGRVSNILEVMARLLLNTIKDWASRP